ncbi:RadC family protein [Pseudodesulfovibrio senegalensis]|uniref:DNA repair protein RadC n=1 Tax=Pseudodesulfovibrio senegalensis TaxID=1721087 RepID=A0A6N6N526_9BACT|nr:DNA repair protein RadC [Pseudodesulfovibrio senegalensis]KAB1442993.1 DNA repair protein RadC [Pseudodesulfovibrio senegalensis]
MTETPHYAGHRQRLRQRLMRDPRSLADYEILELVLASVLPRRDTKPLAKALIERFGSLGAALAAQPEELAECKGVGQGVVAHWHLLQEMQARLAEGNLGQADQLSTVEAVARAGMARIGNKRTEEFWVALLDSSNRVIEWDRVSAGTVDRVDAYPREILALALKRQARSVILVHNHPGGDPTPSEEDRLLTLGVARVAETLEILVRDHVVVADSGYYSFHEHGLL